MWGKGDTPALLVEVQTGTALLDINMAISQKIRKQPSLRPRNSIFGYILKERSIVPEGYVLNYNGIICHSQNPKTT